MNNFLSCELRLVKACESVGEVELGQPLLFQYWSDQLAVFEEPTIFLHEKLVAVGRAPSKHTWEAAGYDLLTWFQWCQLTGIDWRDATEADRQQFADDYAASASDAKTINRKLTIARRFYDFCRNEGWYHRDIGRSREEWRVGNRPLDEDALAHTRTTGTTKEKDPLLRKVGRNVVVRPLQLAQVRKLLNIAGERVESERRGKKKRGAKPTTALFLGHPGSKAAGKPISRSAVQKMFELACRQSGIVEEFEVADLETGKTHIKTVAAHSFHDLRHNCAVLTYHAEKANGNPEPWKIVQVKLGHKSVKVTMDTYLAHVEIFGEKQGLTDIRRLIGL
ncbi:MAG: site-specific integrase [Burkholderiales bacterium]|nr:site-specific integrase [Burkholderiales bacterium]